MAQAKKKLNTWQVVFWVVVIILLILLNLLPFLIKFVHFVPILDWRKGPLSFEKPAYPPDGTEFVGVLLFAILIDLYFIGSLIFNKISEKHEKLKAPWILTILNILFVIAFFVILEVGVRSFVRSHLLTPYRPSSDLFWVMQPSLRNFYSKTGNYYINTDSNGFRGDREISRKKPPGVFRIMGIGDSGPFGHGVDDDQTWTVQLENLLHEKYPDKKIEVINACVPGWTSQEGLLFLERKGLSYHPDLVILGFNDDSGYDYEEEKNRLIKNPAAEAISRVLYNSEFYLLLRKIFIVSKINISPDIPEKPGPDRTKKHVRRVSRADFEKNTQATINLIKKHNVKLILVNNPICLPTYNNFNTGFVQDEILKKAIDFSYRESLKQIAAKNKIPLLNAHDDWAKRENVMDLFNYNDFFHPNPAGHRLIATQLMELIEENKLIP